VRPEEDKRKASNPDMASTHISPVVDTNKVTSSVGDGQKPGSCPRVEAVGSRAICSGNSQRGESRLRDTCLNGKHRAAI
jgi:hypothetical protein